MALALNKQTLVTAVRNLISAEFVPLRKRFSAHDVTTRLREKVLEQVELMGPIVDYGYVPLVEPNEVGVVIVKGHKVPRIQHDDVKEIVHEFFTVGDMPGYGRVRSGAFWEYDTTENLSALDATA